MTSPTAPALPAPRARDLGHALALEGVTVAWSAAECVIALVSAAAAASVVLLGYGLDSCIEVLSGVVVALRLQRERSGRSGVDLERDERRAARVAGVLLVLLAALITNEALRRLTGHGPHPRESATGIALTALSALAMPWLGHAKLRLARSLGSGALRLEAAQTIACAFFSLSTLLGLLLNAWRGWWWADPLMAMTLVPWMVREGIEPWRSEQG